MSELTDGTWGSNYENTGGEMGRGDTAKDHVHQSPRGGIQKTKDAIYEADLSRGLMENGAIAMAPESAGVGLATNYALEKGADGLLKATEKSATEKSDVRGAMKRARDKILDDRKAAYQVPPLRSSKIAIVGFATESMFEAPFDDPDCEIWILNMLHAHVPRWDRLWEMHDRVTMEVETAELKRNMDHLGVLQKEKARPIYMVKREDDIPCSVRFPVETVTTLLGSWCEKVEENPYFTSTFAYMLAYAVHGIVGRRRDPNVPEPGEEIHVCGVEMLNGEEYAYQRSNAEFMCGLAIGYRIPVFIPKRSALLECDGMYGYEKAESLELLGRMRQYYEDRKRKALVAREEAATRRDQAKADWNSHDGTAQAFDHCITHLTYLIRGGKV